MSVITAPCEAVAVDLADGRAVQLRPVGTADHCRFKSFLENLSAEDRRRRFLQAVPMVRSSLIRQLVDVDQHTHVAWIAVSGDECVGEVRYVRSSTEPSRAEVAFAVAPTMRRVGLAARLVEAVGVVAEADGVETFTSMVAPDNRASAALLVGLGTRLRLEDGTLEGEGPVPGWRGPAPAVAEILRLHGQRRWPGRGVAA